MHRIVATIHTIVHLPPLTTANLLHHTMPQLRRNSSVHTAVHSHLCNSHYLNYHYTTACIISTLSHSNHCCFTSDKAGHLKPAEQIHVAATVCSNNTAFLPLARSPRGHQQSTFLTALIPMAPCFAPRRHCLDHFPTARLGMGIAAIDVYTIVSAASWLLRHQLPAPALLPLPQPPPVPAAPAFGVCLHQAALG